MPAVVVLGICVVALTRHRRPTPGSFPLVAGLGVLLAGFWMTATHVPLVLQASRDEVAVAVAAYHTLPGLAVAALGAIWAGLHWSDTP